MRIAFSGHRSDKIRDKDLLIEKLRDLLLKIKQENSDLLFYTGGSTGFDSLVLIELLKIFKKEQINILIPFSGFESYASKDRNEIRQTSELNQSCSDRVLVVGGDQGTFAAKCYKRNEALVKTADVLICYWDGSSSGTGNTVKLALKKDIDVINIYE